MYITLRACLLILLLPSLATASLWEWFVQRDHRWPPRGPWLWAVSQELPQLYREFNGIDFGHAHLAETLLYTQDQQQVEQARLEVLDFIFSSPPVPPDEEQIAPTFTRMVWEVQRTFNWTHTFHRSLYDLFASDEVQDKMGAYRTLLANYLEKPGAITAHRLDHHGKLWSFPESKTFRDRFGTFNTQIWAYHWLQAGAYDVQLLGSAAKQRELFPRIIAHYHGYLKQPQIEWQFMPMFAEVAPTFTQRFPEAAHIFDNLHMLHDNVDDVLSRPDLYPTVEAKRDRILQILPIYLHRNHTPQEHYAEYHAMAMAAGHGDHAMMSMGPRPPSAKEVLAGKVAAGNSQKQPPAQETPHSGHSGH
ncbi:MAG: hypothetical protein ACRERD_05310 [Candidatus Binatia bacterium]